MTLEENKQDELRFLQTNRGFIGREFLTWLWFSSEANNHSISVPDLGNFRLFIDDKIVLSSSSGSVRESSLKGGTPAYAKEAGTALLAGKLVQEAKFILQDSDRQWNFSLSAEDLSIKNIRLPNVSEPDSQAHITQRITCTRLLTDIIDFLFKKYMALRIQPEFENELIEMRTWVNGKMAYS